MAATKLTAVLEMTTGLDNTATIRRTGGWTESVYWTTGLTTDLRNDFERFCMARATVLPGAARVVGQRYQQVDPIGATQTGGRVFPGNPNYATDIPQMALLLRLPASDYPNIAKKKIACIPDQFIVNGEYKPDPGFEGKMNDLLAQFSLWKFRATNLSPVTYPIFSIAADGSVVTTVTHTFVAGNIVTISKALGPYGVFFNGQFVVTAPITATTFKLADWLNVPTTGGKASLPTVLYPRIAPGGVVNRVTTRKIGRPSTGFVGRVSKKR